MQDNIDPTTPYDLSGNERDVLRSVYRLEAERGPPSGKEINQSVSQRRGQNITKSQLYNVLDSLVKKDLVAKGQRDGRTNEYSISADGEDVLEELARDYISLQASTARADGGRQL